MDTQTAPTSYEGQIRLRHGKDSMNLGTPGNSIREIRQSIQRLPAASETDHAIQPKPRKTKLLIGGLFSKEPSLAAWQSFSANMQAQQSSKPGKSVPYVSSQKMPKHVPKVNSKWDGIPDAVRDAEKERARSRRQSILSNPLTGLRAGTIDGNTSRCRRTSIASSSDSCSTGSKSCRSSDRCQYTESICNSSSGGNDRFPPSQPTRGDSLTPVRQACISKTNSPGENGEPDISSLSTAYLVGDDTQIFGNLERINSVHSRFSPPLPSPVENSPPTPQDHEPFPQPYFSKPTSRNVFLAGEAKPFELSDDVSLSMKDVYLSEG